MIKELISVVVPIYNVEMYLEQCLDSICGQSYADIEIILVDDGSTDSSGKICDNYAEQDERITVIHKKNGGLSDARNTGLKKSSGKYIVFIDSDDYIDEKFVEILHRGFADEQVDISMCQYFELYETEKRFPRSENRFEEDLTLNNDEAFENFLVEKYPGFVVAWNKMYRTSLFRENSIIYPVGKIHEDCFTTWKLFLKSDKIVVSALPLYFYRQRKNSIMSNSNLDKEIDLVEAYSEVLRYCYENNTNIDMAEYRFVISNMAWVKKIRTFDRMEIIKKAHLNIKKVNWRNNKNFSGFRKLRILLFVRFPRVYSMLLICYNRLINN